MLKVVHYINQFYAGIGGEDKADTPPEKRDGAVGPGTAFKGALAGVAEIVGTVICGDSYFNENLQSASDSVLGMIKSYGPDLVIAGPAFNAGRYGMACGTVAKLVEENLHIPVVSGMFEENPGADMFKRYAYVVPTGNSATSMRQAVPAMANIVKQIAAGEEVSEAYMPKGLRKNYFHETRGSKRAVDMLVKKIKGEDFATEYPMPVFDRVDAAPAVPDIKKAKIALVSSGGPVPTGNPDHIESSSASKYGRYSLKDIADFTPENGQTAHGGYDPVYANEDLDRVLPLDVVKEMVTAGEIGSLHDYWYSTVGNGTAVASSKKFAAEIVQFLKDDHVDAVILTSTWGTCTRCGATMVKEIERAGFPVVHMCTVVPISLTVGANRIVPTVAIPYPLGNPKMIKEDEKELRRKLVRKALKALETPVSGQTVFED